LIVSNAISATVAWIVFLLLCRGGTTLFELAWSMALFYGGFAILTVIQYKVLANKIEKGKLKESHGERTEQAQDFAQEKQTEESDTHES
jgi:hypothetical protein